MPYFKPGRRMDRNCRECNSEEEVQQADLVAYFKYCIKKYPLNLSGEMWCSAMLNLFIKSHEGSDIPFDVLEKTLKDAMEIYRPFYGHKE